MVGLLQEGSVAANDSPSNMIIIEFFIRLELKFNKLTEYYTVKKLRRLFNDDVIHVLMALPGDVPDVPA